MINPLIRMQKKNIKLWAYIDSEVPREYPDLKNNHRPKRNPDQETKNQANKESPSLHTGKARSLALLTQGKRESLSTLPLLTQGKRESLITYTEVSLCGCEKGARVFQSRVFHTEKVWEDTQSRSVKDMKRRGATNDQNKMKIDTL